MMAMSLKNKKIVLRICYKYFDKQWTFQLDTILSSEQKLLYFDDCTFDMSRHPSYIMEFSGYVLYDII